MPFSRISRPLSLEDFEPDEDHDPLMDLIQVTCGTQALYIVSPVKGVWAVDSATMPTTILRNFTEQKKHYPSSPGVKVDQAEVGKPLLLSLGNFDWVGIWRSVYAVTDLTAVTRDSGLYVTEMFSVEENR